MSVILAIASASSADRISSHLSQQANSAIASADGLGVKAQFFTRNGWPTRHPILEDATGLATDEVRDRVAKAVAAVPGVGGVSWLDGTMIARGAKPTMSPLHCQEDVEALLAARTIRFEESSAAIDAGSAELIDEVAEALQPCLGSIIAVVGHTDNSGDAKANLILSRNRARAVRDELIQRGIPRDGMRASGVGAQQPVDGLDPADPANRRIEFSVLRVEPLKPTPVDTPGPR